MNHCQRKLGMARGASRYAEVILMADSMFMFGGFNAQSVASFYAKY
jgi:hypothetical protein